MSISKKILVTGGNGFIASHIVDAYIKAGHRVVVVDNMATGLKSNINKKAKFYKVDIADFKAVRDIFKKERPEIVNHHAAIAEVVKSLKDPAPTFEKNVLGTTNILSAFAQYGKGHKKFLFASTGGAIYGQPKKIPADENTLATPLSPYGASKLLGEEAIKFYARTNKFNYLIFRYPNVYGPRQNPKGEAGVVAIFGGLMKAGKIPTIFGDGKKTRDYVYVTDIVKANLLGLSKGRDVTINLGSGRQTSDKEIFDVLAKVSKFTKPVKYLPHREGEVKKIALTFAKAKKILGWSPKISLEKGIVEAYNSLK